MRPAHLVLNPVSNALEDGRFQSVSHIEHGRNSPDSRVPKIRGLMPEQRHDDGRGTGVVPSQIECFHEATRPVCVTSCNSVGNMADVTLMLREAIPFLTLDLSDVAFASDGQLGVFVECC